MHSPVQNPSVHKVDHFITQRLLLENPGDLMAFRVMFHWSTDFVFDAGSKIS